MNAVAGFARTALALAALPRWAMSRFLGAPASRPMLALALGSDESLVARAAGGDRQAFDDLYRRYVDVVWARLGRLIGPDPEREDLLQQIFLDLFRALPRFRGDASLRTFLYRIVLNTASDHLKRRRRSPAAIPDDQLDELMDADASPEQRVAERQRLARTFAALDRLKPKKRIAFLLRVVEGLSLDEIAELTDATPAAVAQRVRHAHRELKAMTERPRPSAWRRS
ncbi:MAG TPA: sigma-70 family RNA polymerase sigma factor [Polyangia bacterium]|nr:sigma-70 family RNA polymerase sigma factor [Polyangia bacterium]